MEWSGRLSSSLLEIVRGLYSGPGGRSEEECPGGFCNNTQGDFQHWDLNITETTVDDEQDIGHDRGQDDGYDKGQDKRHDKEHDKEHFDG